MLLSELVTKLVIFHFSDLSPDEIFFDGYKYVKKHRR